MFVHTVVFNGGDGQPGVVKLLMNLVK